MAEEKKSKGSVLYDKAKPKGEAHGSDKEMRPKEAGEPKKEPKTPEPKGKDGGGERAPEGDGASKAPAMPERHAKEREAMHTAHRAERRDMHGNHRSEHDKMHARHEEQHQALAAKQSAEMANPGEATPGGPAVEPGAGAGAGTEGAGAPAGGMAGQAPMGA
jgi:hypothetical protein